MPLEKLRAIYELLFRDGVLVAKKDKRPQSKHSEIQGVSNLQVLRAMVSLKSRGYVRETFTWMHFYWYLTNEGVVYLRNYLRLPPEIVPSSLQRVRRPAATLDTRSKALCTQSIDSPTSYTPKPAGRSHSEGQESLDRQTYRQHRRDAALDEAQSKDAAEVKATTKLGHLFTSQSLRRLDVQDQSVQGSGQGYHREDTIEPNPVASTSCSLSVVKCAIADTEEISVERFTSGLHKQSPRPDGKALLKKSTSSIKPEMPAEPLTIELPLMSEVRVSAAGTNKVKGNVISDLEGKSVEPDIHRACKVCPKPITDGLELEALHADGPVGGSYQGTTGVEVAYKAVLMVSPQAESPGDGFTVDEDKLPINQDIQGQFPNTMAQDASKGTESKLTLSSASTNSDASFVCKVKEQCKSVVTKALQTNKIQNTTGMKSTEVKVITESSEASSQEVETSRLKEVQLVEFKAVPDALPVLEESKKMIIPENCDIEPPEAPFTTVAAPDTETQEEESLGKCRETQKQNLLTETGFPFQLERHVGASLDFKPVEDEVSKSHVQGEDAGQRPHPSTTEGLKAFKF